MASHTDEQLDQVVEILNELAVMMGLPA
jgi:hypothetical protein